MLLLVRRRTIIAASLSLIIFSATVSVLIGIGSVPNTLLGNPDVYVITSKGSESILNSRLDASLSDQLLSNGFVTNASPEIFAFAEISGRAIIIRGVEFEPFLGVEGARLISGKMPSDPSQGLIGDVLAERLQTKLGDRYTLVGSYGSAVGEVEVTGIIRSSSGVEDELIVSLPLARCLSGTPENSVSIIRVIGDTAQLNKMFGPNVPRISIFDLAIDKSIVGVGTNASVSIKVNNWGIINGTADVKIVDMPGNATVVHKSLNVTAGSIGELEANYTFTTIGNHTITAYLLNATLPQNISANISVRNPYLTLICQRQVVEFNNFTVQVIDNALRPVSGADVQIAGHQHQYITNASGRCIINETLANGSYTINASHPGFDNGTTSVAVVESSSLPQNADIRTYDLVLTPDTVKVRENCMVMVYVQNYGNKSGNDTIVTYVGGYAAASQYVSLDPFQSVVLYYNLTFATEGDRAVTSGPISRMLAVESTYQLNPELIQLLIRYGGSSTLDPSRSDLLYHTTKISEANILIVIVSLAVLSATLVTLGISTTFMKEINDNLRVIGILRSLGASSRQLLGIIFREAILLSLPAAAIGIAGGFLLAVIISSTGGLVAFGHLISPALDPSFLIAAIAGSVAICVGSSLIAGLSVARRRTIRMIRGQREEFVKQVTLRELLGEE